MLNIDYLMTQQFHSTPKYILKRTEIKDSDTCTPIFTAALPSITNNNQKAETSQVSINR